LGNPTVGYQGPPPEDTNSDRDLLLWELLFASPSLEHFKAVHVPLSTKVLWGDHAHSADGTFRATATGQMWSCRGLKTLTLTLNTQEQDWTPSEEIDILTRRIFGYLGRVCPQLQDLTLVVPCRLYAMKGGLCLLTRLQNLRHLAIYTSFSDQDPTIPTLPRKQDFVWMQGIAYSKGRVTAFAPQPRGLPHARRVSAFEDHKLCLDTVRMWSTAVHDVGPDTIEQVEACRYKMQRQQIQHEYLSSPEEPESPVRLSIPPMVDGLVDMEFCGSFLDMEALLLARLDRFQKEVDRHQDFTRQWQDAASGPEGAQPWPHLERIVLSNGSVDLEDLESVRHQANLALKAMSELRPDVEVIRQYSEYPHLLLNL